MQKMMALKFYNSNHHAMDMIYFLVPCPGCPLKKSSFMLDDECLFGLLKNSAITGCDNGSLLGNKNEILMKGKYISLSFACSCSSLIANDIFIYCQQQFIWQI